MYVIQYHTMLYKIIRYYTVFYNIVQYSRYYTKNSNLQYFTLLYIILKFYTILYNIIQYYIYIDIYMAVHQNVLALEKVFYLRSPVRLAHSWCVGASDLRHAREPARCGTGLDWRVQLGVSSRASKWMVYIDILQHIHSNPRKGWKQ